MEVLAKWLITADIHLSDRPKDQYRFGLFRWLAKQQQQYQTDAIFILGDITQDKDNHSSALVNRAVDEIINLRPPVFIVRGNHDGIDPSNPYFRFLNCIDGITFAVEPTFLSRMGIALIPHCRSQRELDENCRKFINPYAVMCHQTFDGAVAETGARLSGLSASPIESLKPKAVYTGDVHRPQQHGLVTYVGAPYAVRFGDDFTPRVLLVNNGQGKDLHFDCPRKWSLKIKTLDDLTTDTRLKKGDQVKITVEWGREELVNWTSFRQRIIRACHELGLELYGLESQLAPLPQSQSKPKEGASHADTLKAFCKAEKVPSSIIEVGLALIGTENAAVD